MSAISAPTPDRVLEQPVYIPQADHVADPAAVARQVRWTARALHGLQLTLATLFLVVGAATLLGAPEIVAQFGTIENATGLGAWVRTATGLLEVLGGVLLLMRASAGVGAVLLGLVMTGAALTDVVVLHSSAASPALLVAALAGVAYAHRARLAGVAAFLERNL